MPSNQEQKKRVITFTLKITVMTDFMESFVSQILNTVVQSIGQQKGIQEISHELNIVTTEKKSEVKRPAA